MFVYVHLVVRVKVCVCVCGLGCLLMLTVCSCLLSFNLDSGIDILPTGSCYNFLDVRYYAA